MLRGLLPGKEWSGTLDCVRYHHAKALRQARMEKDSLAYVACIADNIAAAADRREVEGESQGLTARNRCCPCLRISTASITAWRWSHP